MNRMKWRLIAVLLAGAVLTDGPSQQVKADSMTVIEFNDRLDSLDVPQNLFGVFGNPAQQQAITQDFIRTRVPDNSEMGFLQLTYTLNARGSYNGWWLKTREPRNLDKEADWSAYRDGGLVLRVRAGRGCTDVFKLEIKTRGKVFANYVRLTPQQLKALRQTGVADIVLPFADLVGRREPLNSVSELVLVFEHDRIPPAARRGTLLLAAVWLIKPIEPKIDGKSILADQERKAFGYFEDHCHPVTGLVRDRARNFAGRKDEPPPMASIAATGFYLAVLPEAARRKWITRDHAQREATRALGFAERLEHRHGLLYHFVSLKDGKRWKNSEISILDSAIFLNGAITAASAFPAVAPVVERLLDRVQWKEFLTEKDGKKLLALGWTPEKGLLGPMDVRTSEAAMAYLLAIGSKNAVGPECWYNTATNEREIASRRVLHGELPLFVSYYGLAWADLKGLKDKDGIDLHGNAIRAALANRAFCRSIATRQHTTYRVADGGWWGISAGDSAEGYVAPGPIQGDANGFVWPVTALAAVPWVPKEIEADLEQWRASRAWSRVVGKYGIAPFNLDTGWVGDDIIGIDLGAFLVNMANYRNRTVWDLWRKHPVAQAALRRVGFDKK
ncbi:MAG: hypothetical protein HYS12_20610 [Planctomycetes bacterium]|nr:hypothetical protein [Planctomycetota bacterium]